MALKLYTQDMSPTCRAVYLTAAALGLELELTVIDVWKKEQFLESFLKINPQHTIPTLDDNNTVIWDSNAINIYLVSKYGKDDFLYPNDFKIQRVINQRLFYNASFVFPIGRRIILKTAKRIFPNKEDTADLNKVYKMIETFLESSVWISCDNVTIADFCLVSSITSFNAWEPLDARKYPKLLNWIQNLKTLPYYWVADKGTKDFEQFVSKRLNKSVL
ncbi:hypothetical protein RN001_009606 [Aquatica leii]|uniref:Glutathione S-transferase n=1 Tax=Aquatica leii TaxID=1421715 RepID=A0AAN7Q2L2_9COLE|nr:hypothetical protein RN001_009606 [Aquatica leii]